MLFHEHVGGALGDSLEAGQSRPDALPEIRDGCRIRLPLAGPNGWLHTPGIIRGYSSSIAEIAHPVVRRGRTTISVSYVLRVDLELEGYRVLEAGTAQEVRSDREVTSLILGVRLGEDNGVDLARAVRRAPRLAIAFLTGAWSARGGGAEATPHQKPFDLDVSETVAH